MVPVGRPRRPVRLVLLDLSGSMRTQCSMLQRALAAVPESGTTAVGVRVLVMTDGVDTDSEGNYNGVDGLMHLINEATARGWNCSDGDTNTGPTFGSLRITLLDVSSRGCAARGAAMKSARATLVWTNKPEYVERVIAGKRRTGQRPRQGTLLDEGQISGTYADVCSNRVREAALSISVRGVPAVLDLDDVINAHIGDTDKARTRAAINKALEGTETGYIVDKRGADHSNINGVLWTLKRANVLDAERQKGRRGLSWKRTARYEEMTSKRLRAN